MAARRKNLLASPLAIVMLAILSLIAGISLTLALRHSITDAIGHEDPSDKSGLEDDAGSTSPTLQRSLAENFTEGAPMPGPEAQDCAEVPDFPKVAMMFLSRGLLWHEPMWTRWFREAEGLVPLSAIHKAACKRWSFKKGRDVSGVDCWKLPQKQEAFLEKHDKRRVQRLLNRQFLFNIYVHTRPDFPGFPESSIFYGREISDRVEASWGSITLIDALRKLLAAALTDPLNMKLMLLSESGVPLFAPQLIYSQILFEERSRLDSCGGGERSAWRWTGEMEVPGVLYEGDFRKSSQWVGLRRDHAQLVVKDRKVYQKFKDHCFLDTRWWWRDCYSDEHYVPTLIACLQHGHETDCHGNLVNVQWQQGAAHPRNYAPDEVDPGLIHWIRDEACGDIDAAHRLARSTMYDVRKGQDHWEDDFCASRLSVPTFNSTIGPACSLFARKFAEDTSTRVLSALAGCNSSLNITSPASCAREDDPELIQRSSRRASRQRSLQEWDDSF